MSEYFSIQLPSKCKLYPDVQPSKVLIRPFTGKEEKAIADATPQNFDVKFQQILASVVQGIDVNKLTLGDRKYIMLWLVINSYSPKFPVSFECDTCNARLEMDVDLSQMLSEDLPDTYTEPMEIDLPSGNKIKLRLLRVEDELKANALEKSGQNVWLMRYAASIVPDDTKVSVLDRAVSMESMSTKDIAMIRAFHEKYEHGPKMESEYTCGKCGGDGLVAVPFRLQMFLPSGEVLKRYFGKTM